VVVGAAGAARPLARTSGRSSGSPLFFKRGNQASHQFSFARLCRQFESIRLGFQHWHINFYSARYDLVKYLD
jgi:hypothetical protein